MPAHRLRLPAALLAAALLAVAMFFVATAGMQALERTDPHTASPSPGNVPDFIYQVPDTVRTTADYGPVGPVSLVFAAPKVREGLFGEMQNPWVAVSSENGDYRALSAPHRPEAQPRAVSLSPSGHALAWGFEGGVVVYDPLTDKAREIGESLEGVPRMGRFSPDGRLLAVYDGALRVLDIETGDVVGTLSGVDERAARQAVWLPAGESLSYVADGALVTHSWRDDSRTSVPTTIQRAATLAWSPSGEQIAAMRDVRGVRVVEVFDVAGDGRLRQAGTTDRDGYAQQELFGFVTDTSVAVSALTLQTATLPLAFEMSTSGEAGPAELMQLPPAEVSLQTLEVAAEPLSQGSAPFAEPNWPASELAKLTGSIIVAVFFLGLYITRRPR